jgi:hypothetical protein
MIGFILLAMKRRASAENENEHDGFAAAAGFGLVGVLVAGQFHQPFLTFPVPWTLWAVAGFALSTYRPELEERVDSDQSADHIGVR